MAKLPKYTKNFIKYHSEECTQSFHRMSKEKRINFWDEWWRSVMSRPELMHRIGEMILNKVMPTQIHGEGLGGNTNYIIVRSGTAVKDDTKAQPSPGRFHIQPE